MSTVFRLSEAGSLALHATAFLAANPDDILSAVLRADPNLVAMVSTRQDKSMRLSAAQIAAALSVSESHLAKVLQRLARAGLVRSVRGPNGGYTLAKASDKITLLDVYEAVEGPLSTNDCLLGVPICSGRTCIFGGLVKKLNTEVKEHLAGTKLANLQDLYRSRDARGKKHR